MKNGFVLSSPLMEREQMRVGARVRCSPLLWRVRARARQPLKAAFLPSCCSFADQKNQFFLGFWAAVKNVSERARSFSHFVGLGKKKKIK